MRAALDEARAALATGDVPIGAVVARRRRARSSAAAATCARPTATRPGTPRWSRCAGRPRRRGAWRLDGCTLVVTLEPCTMCAGAVGAGAGRTAWSSARTTQGRRGRQPVGRGPRPPAQPPSRGGRGRARRGGHGPAGRFLPPPPPRVASPAVACPSGLRRTPRKRLWVQAHRGFKSLRHRRWNRPLTCVNTRGRGRFRVHRARYVPDRSRWRRDADDLTKCTACVVLVRRR